ncbi:hypothetical protein PR048_033270 [Dryococelus australis]|uniref:Uncharacterized protein n=1 Tax=Dryococelus australis TaxID=614101 RepID=A0ABQ9FZT1_9NEOP|nr:hypothetical protein PR048_033270 [Dryococelus australis]
MQSIAQINAEMSTTRLNSLRRKSSLCQLACCVTDTRPPLSHNDSLSSSSLARAGRAKVRMDLRRNVRAGRDRDFPEKTRWPAASSGAIFSCENPGVTPRGNRTQLALVGALVPESLHADATCPSMASKVTERNCTPRELAASHLGTSRFVTLAFSGPSNPPDIAYLECVQRDGVSFPAMSHRGRSFRMARFSMRGEYVWKNEERYTSFKVNWALSKALLTIYLRARFVSFRHVGSYFIEHVLGNCAPMSEHFTLVCCNHAQFSQKGRGFRSVRQPMEKRGRLRWEMDVQIGAHDAQLSIRERDGGDDGGRGADKIDVKHVYTEVDFAIGSQFIRHALDDSEPTADSQGNNAFVFRPVFIYHAPGNSVPKNERFTTVCSHHVKFTHKGNDLSSTQEPMDKRRRFETMNKAVSVIAIALHHWQDASYDRENNIRYDGGESCLGSYTSHAGNIRQLLHDATRLPPPPPPKANGVRFRAGSLPDFRSWESCRTKPLVGGVLSGISRFTPPLHSCAASYSPRFTFVGSQDLTPQSSAYWNLSCVFIGCCPAPGCYGIRKEFPCKSAIGSEACRAGLINCDPIVKWVWSGAGMKVREKREIPEKTPPTNGIARHGSNMRKSGVTRPGIEPGSPWWEASGLTVARALLRLPLSSVRLGTFPTTPCSFVAAVCRDDVAVWVPKRTRAQTKAEENFSQASRPTSRDRWTDGRLTIASPAELSFPLVASSAELWSVEGLDRG